MKWIRRFPGMTGVVCPSFWMLNFAYGCPWMKCEYCYLRGTLRHQGLQLKFYKGMTPGNLQGNLIKFFEEHKEPTVLNTGEICDSLACERNNWLDGLNFTEWAIPFFEGQDHEHKILFLSKLGKNIGNLQNISEKFGFLHRTILSFSLNAPGLCWYIGEPPLETRLNALRIMKNQCELRVRIDPIMPVEKDRDFSGGYQRLATEVAKINPSRVTLGMLRINNPALPQENPEFWNGWLPKMNHIGHGKYRVKRESQITMLGLVMDALRSAGYKGPMALCKEPEDLWHAVGLNPNQVKCNCVM